MFSFVQEEEEEEEEVEDIANILNLSLEEESIKKTSKRKKGLDDSKKCDERPPRSAKVNYKKPR